MPEDDAPTSARPDDIELTRTTGAPGAPAVAANDVLSGRYEIVSEIGQGGFGRVYRARDKLLDRSVAIKILSADGDASPSSRQRFLKEARASARLQHANVVALHDAGEDPKGLFLVLELVTGTGLKRRLESGPMSAAEASATVRQIAEALAAAHSLGIVHRDIKPANVLLTQEGVVKVADFGIARLVGETQITAEGRILGTPHYMAPEQIEGKLVTPKADLFALGCLFYELLSGETPFRGSFTEVLAKILRSEPGPLSPELPLSIRTLVARLLAKNPDERPSAAEVVSELTLPAIDHPVSGHPNRARPAWVGRTALVVASVAAMYFIGSFRSDPAMETKRIALARLRASPESMAFFEKTFRETGIDGVTLTGLDDRHLELTAEPDTLANASSMVELFDSLEGYDAASEPNLFTAGSPSDRVVSLDFKNLSLPGALNVISAAARWPVVQGPSLGGDVTFRLVEVSWDVAVRTLFDANDLTALRYGGVWLVTRREVVTAMEELEELEVVVKRPARVSPEAMTQALESARTGIGAIHVNPRLGAVVIADRAPAFQAYEKIYAAIEGPEYGAADFPAPEWSGEILPSPGLYATEAPLDDVLRYFADVSGLNIVFLARLGPEEERLSLSVQGVPWDNALEVLIRSRRLLYTVDQNMVQVTSPDQRGTEPVVETITLQREDPEFFRPFEKCLTSAGSLGVEPRSRTLIIRDVPWRAGWFQDFARMVDERSED